MDLTLGTARLFTNHLIADPPNWLLLSFPALQLSSSHADLRVSLREVRKGQRDTGSFKGVEGDQMSLLRLAEAFKEIVRFCLVPRRYRRALLHRQTQFVRHVRNRAAAFALDNFKIQVAHQTIDAFLECLSARDLDPIHCSWRDRGVDEIV